MDIQTARLARRESDAPNAASFPPAFAARSAL